jgi:hypothetical protein
VAVEQRSAPQMAETTTLTRKSGAGRDAPARMLDIIICKTLERVKGIEPSS